VFNLAVFNQEVATGQVQRELSMSRSSTTAIADHLVADHLVADHLVEMLTCSGSVAMVATILLAILG
jgi:hypothetical protein